jgi:hypothetical protein
VTTRTAGRNTDGERIICDQQRSPSEPLAAALEWIELCRVVPCRGKNPGAYLGSGWHKQASRDPARLREWWQRWPTANLGIVPGRELVPVDVDDPAGFERFQREHGPAPPTPRCYTNGDPDAHRERLIFRHPGIELRDELAPGVQLRDGERVSIVPPSINPNTGLPYEWRDALDELPIAPLPDAWLVIVKTSETKQGAKPASLWRELMTGVRDGSVSGEQGRKRATTRLAGYLFNREVDPFVVLELLVAWDARNKPPLGRAEIERAVRWVAAQEVRKWTR